MRDSMLIAEQEKALRDSLKEWFADEGYEVVTAESGGKALKLLESGRFSVLVVDQNLPGVDGLTLLREARSRDPRVRVLVTTLNPTVPSAVEAMKGGASDYIAKPFTPEQLQEALDKILGRSRITGGPAPREGTPDAFTEPFNKGKELYHQGRFQESAKALEEATKILPAHFEAHYLLNRARQAQEENLMRKPGSRRKAAAPSGTEAPAEEKECVWMKAKVVAYRMCTRNFQCADCEFGQAMQETKKSGKEDPKVAEMLRSLKNLPAGERKCRYMLSGKVSFRTCNKLYECYRCEYDQMMQDYPARGK